MPDQWEKANRLNPHRNDAKADADRDGLINREEFKKGTKPHKADTDSDGMRDGWEATHHLDAVHNDAAGDPDSDGLTNVQENAVGDDPHNADSDADGLPDAQEDTDHDGLSDQDEFRVGDNPRKGDSDGNGVPDGSERSGVITSFDQQTGLLTVALGNNAVSVTVDRTTTISWHHATSQCPHAAGPSDLLAGQLVHKIRVSGSGDEDEGKHGGDEQAATGPPTLTAMEVSLVCS
jgi:hypothetical protein